VTAVPRPAADRAGAYRLEPVYVDGNDVEAVHAAARRALRRARGGEGPSLIEAVTYRHGGHSRADPAKYRPAAEVEAWLARDPVACYRDHLLGTGTAESVLAEAEAAVQCEVDEATEEARAAPPADVEYVGRDLWADGSATWRN
jgi:pyruvate dehydrogenase E1 component alpha subunit